MLFRTIAASIVLVLTACAGPRSAPAPGAGADLILRNGIVWTGVPGAAPATAVAIRGGEIVAIGTNDEVARLIGPETRIVELQGRMVTPGFIDTHVHFIGSGFQLTWVDLRDASTPEEFARRIGEYASRVPAGTWIQGGDWDHTLWGGDLPRRDWIDSITPHHPVFVNRLDGHMALANTIALEAAGLSAASPEVEGGEMVRYPDGSPTGLLRDNAMDPVYAVIPDASEDERDRALDAAMRYVNERGVTTVHNVGSWSDLATFRRAHAEGRLTTRIYAATPLSQWTRMRDEVQAHGPGDEWLRIGALKGFVDGSLGSHTAAFHDPFTDDPESRGLLVNSPEALYDWISGADAVGLHLLIHAIGDRANDLLLDTFDRVAAENGPRDRRFRIEHAQHLTPRAIERMAETGVIASMQPYHAIDDGRWAEAVIGPDRALTTYAFRSLLDAGAVVAFGSDWSVAPPTPLEGIYAAVTRRTLDGGNPGGWVPQERITVEEALAAYTRAGAYASFEEAIKGTLEVGKLADLVVIDRNLLEVEPEDIRTATVDMTIVGGTVVWER